MNNAAVTPPPAAFNFAQHLLTVNAGRAAKAAFVDDLGSLSYGVLDERVRRVAAGLRALNFYHRRAAVQASTNVLAALAPATAP